MYGKSTWASRVTYLIGPDGRSQAAGQGEAETHAEEVLEAIRELNAVARDPPFKLSDSAFR